MAVDVVDVVVWALSAGAAVGVKDTASTAVKDAYAGLRAVLRRRWGQDQAEDLVAVAEDEDSDTQARRSELRRVVTEAGVVIDDEVLEAARRVLEQLDPAGIRAGKYVVDARQATGVQIGDGNSMTLNL
ncbi:MAG TPA: hypothetical protein VEO01_21000 [Pseudonocardiaceae bacterium]|nr:hypothetical protein [Pseudonocardiaceae bacterium]